ncbi:MAG: galactose mutarotase [Lachnospiraceae bacterium]|nr:galactose mutarotase [Lachnospiraceae bacterium]
MSVTTRSFGKTGKGEEVTLYRIENSKGMAAEVIDFGAILVSLFVADRNGKFDDVILGYDTLDKYLTNQFFFGATIGRNANRIKNAHFTINGVEYTLEKNWRESNLHSSTENGYHKRMFKAEIPDDNSVRLNLFSPDQDQGFPGNLNVSVTYRVAETNTLEIEYEGISDADTIVNMTNHSYFNLSGHASGSAMNHKLWLKASSFTPADENDVPTGEIASVASTPFDFTQPQVIGARIDDDHEQLRIAGGYDHNFILDTTGVNCEQIAILSDEASGRRMSVYSDMPALQFYAGNYIAPHTGKGGVEYGKRCGVCLETQFVPNAINEPRFKAPLLKAGEKYRSVTKYCFNCE